MSWMPARDADETIDCPAAVDMVITPRTNDIGGFEVQRALPFRDRRMVGPFIFWDQMGPGEFLTGKGLDVRPHPHIGLSTVTYLFDGIINHKDSLGNNTEIVPGDVNLMTAGNGIVHSERTPQALRGETNRLFGIQSWIAQPKEFEQGEQDFKHYMNADLPTFDENGIKGKVLMGQFSGVSSPIQAQWDTLYVELHLNEGAVLNLPADVEERAIYLVKGQIEISHTQYKPEQMLILAPKDRVTVKASKDTHILLLGGATMDGKRYIWWNLVASDKDLLEDAKQRWKDGAFPLVPGDEQGRIPLPD